MEELARVLFEEYRARTNVMYPDQISSLVPEWEKCSANVKEVFIESTRALINYVRSDPAVIQRARL